MVLLPHKYCYKNRGNMTLNSIKEYALAIRDRFVASPRCQPGEALLFLMFLFEEFIKAFLRKSYFCSLVTFTFDNL